MVAFMKAAQFKDLEPGDMYVEYIDYSYATRLWFMISMSFNDNEKRYETVEILLTKHNDYQIVHDSVYPEKIVHIINK